MQTTKPNFIQKIQHTSFFQKIQNSRYFKDKPPAYIFIMLILAIIALILVVFLLKKMLGHNPKSYDHYYENIDQVIAFEDQASEWSQVYQPLEKQIGTEAYDNLVLGIGSYESNANKTAVQLQRDAIIAVERNNEQARELGGVATPAELTQYKAAPKDALAAARVDEIINLSQGIDDKNAIVDALNAPEK